VGIRPNPRVAGGSTAVQGAQQIDGRAPAQRIVLASLTAATFAKTVESLAPRDVTLALPKTEVRWNGDLGDDLRALGMRNAMSPGNAQLSRISAVPLLYVQSVLHATYLRVDEKGTEAAAITMHNTATYGVIGTTAMTVDRPYLMAIVDDDSGAVLFLAAIRDPSGQ
jgi:serine protease inhibitor